VSAPDVVGRGAGATGSVAGADVGVRAPAGAAVAPRPAVPLGCVGAGTTVVVPGVVAVVPGVAVAGFGGGWGLATGGCAHAGSDPSASTRTAAAETKNDVR
jgi:hypothetical protein